MNSNQYNMKKHCLVCALELLPWQQDSPWVYSSSTVVWIKQCGESTQLQNKYVGIGQLPGHASWAVCVTCSLWHWHVSLPRLTQCDSVEIIISGPHYRALTSLPCPARSGGPHWDWEGGQEIEGKGGKGREDYGKMDEFEKMGVRIGIRPQLLRQEGINICQSNVGRWHFKRMRSRRNSAFTVWMATKLFTE